MKFCEVERGGRFEYQGQVYSRMHLNFAKHQQQQTVVIFPSEAEVRALSDFHSTPPHKSHSVLAFC